ncbi:FAD:protein FMN transferase [Actinocrinis puniceicyclus]|uniref:FAD:protein FMN transferase n=1 Tax=Actinocrinis puniceicyclus TaxID=977794 RepID=A0A8J8BE84_9ACTN|nr:FAD:protein FMN transferase [Actinocrinis puniceicyclus]MBS2967027.1 FAD:protein FMN transferase [Actinocrinis puniceicyclus]
MRTAVEHIMGTAISLATPDETDPALFAEAARAAYAYLRRIDEIFSTYKPDSPISRIRDGRLPLTELPAHPDGDLIREILALCAQLHRESRGGFDAWNVGDPPLFDPSGAVKGWAAENASRVLTEHGLTRHALNAGGDVRVRGGTSAATTTTTTTTTTTQQSTAGPTPWRIGVADPHRPGQTLLVFERCDGAVATSGTAERGLHVYDPRTHRPATALVQVTVTGEDLALADGYATAALALAGAASPADACAWLTDLAERGGYESLTVQPDGGAWWTAGLRRYAPALPAHPRDNP